jgi:DNA-binding transcriptional MerR regulator
MAIMRMADTAVNSNEAVFRWVLPTIESLPKQNRINAMQAFIGSVQEKLNTKSKADIASATNILNFIKDKKITSLDQFFKEVILDSKKRSKGISGSQLKLDNRSLIYDLIFAPKGIKTASKPTVKALLSGTDNSKNKIFTSDIIYSSIGEPSMLKSKQGEVVSVVGIDVKNGGVISVDHGNYGFGPKGKTIALIENPTHGIDVFPEWKAKSSRVFKKDKAGKVPSPESVATQTGGAFFTDKAMRGAKVFADVISDINLLIGKIRFAFPSVSVSTTQQEFDNIINSPDVRTQVSDGKIILGLTKDGKIYLNPAMSSLQTPIHEFGHIWIDFLRSKDSGKKGTDLLSKGLDLIRDTKEHKKAIEKYGNTEIALEEALVELMANKGATIIDAAKRSKFKSWMNATFKYIQDKFTTFKDLDASKISKIKLDDFINIGLADLFSGKEVSAKFAPELSESAFKARMSAITDINEIVKIGLDNGISIDSITKVLKDKNFNEKEISLAVYNAISKDIKLDESNVENAIELLDEIEDNKRKAERASSKRKADLEQKISEAETELDKIQEEAKIVKVINDNFDKIKKDLKEQGLLNVKC